MLEGKFKCVKSTYPNKLTEGKVYEFVNGECIYDDGEISSSWRSLNHWHEYNNGMRLEPYIEPDQPKILSNSDIWKLAEDGLISDGEKFEYAGEAIFEYINMMYDDGEFVFIDSLEFAHEATFCVEDKWLPLPSKPKLSKREAEELFGVEIVD